MADYLRAYERMIRNEGGYKLTNVKHDKGGQTYAGIARNRWSKWDGWKFIDTGDTPPTDLVRTFYLDNFWTLVRGDQINGQRVAENIFDFAVNAGVSTAAKLAQIVVGATPDGVIGSKSLVALNAFDEETFVVRYALAKLARYEQIVSKDRTQDKFLLGWLRRTLREAV